MNSVSAEMNKGLGKLLTLQRCTEQKFLPLLHRKVSDIILGGKKDKFQNYIITFEVKKRNFQVSEMMREHTYSQSRE